MPHTMKRLSINGRATNIPVLIAETFFQRLRGLMGEKQGTHALLLPHCRSIHTCFMRYPIDVVCLDKDYIVTRFIPSCKPWGIIINGKKTRRILEIPAGFLLEKTINAGDKVVLIEYN